MAATPERRFLQWLLDNGAAFPKLEWPARVAGGRGVRATEAIAPREELLRVPARLLISEQLCWADAQLGRVFRENRDVFSRDDPVLALFLVRELARGDRSFFQPYLAILPEPDSVQDWTDAELDELRDRRLADAAKHRTAEIRAFYERIFTRLEERYPGEFPRAEFTMERFVFAWKTIQARTFGRRLPWTALVPFADCLNHANVATTYDFDVGGNGCFRLFPSRSTTYDKGAEVYNSYGRRPNFQLLLDYGFALENNEWDFVDLELPKDRPGGRKVRFATRSARVVRIDRHTTLDELFPPDLLVATLLPSIESLRLEPPPSPSTNLEDTGTTSDHVPMDQALQWIKQILINALEDLGSAGTDEELLSKKPEIPYRLQAAIIHRSSRRRLLQRMCDQVNAKLTELQQAHTL